MSTLLLDDLLWVNRRLPSKVRDVMKEHPRDLILAGGFIRSIVAREPVQDVDLFVPTIHVAEVVAAKLSEGDSKRVHKTDNALTVTGGKLSIQIIRRWTYDAPEKCVASFDFSIACAAVWWDGEHWQSLCDDRFYPDLAAKRLHYLSPERNEDAGGSLLRVLKFYQRGYTMSLPSLGNVIARLLNGVEEVNWSKRGTMDPKSWERQMGHVLTGLLREVDPSIDPDHIAHDPSTPEPEPAK